MTVRDIITLVVFLAFITGCSSERETGRPDNVVTASDIITAVNAQSSSIQTFSAVGSMNIETSRLSQSAGFEIAIKKSNGTSEPDSLRIAVEGPFGITIARALFTQNRFIAYNALTNTVYTGDAKKGLRAFPFLSDIDTEVLIDAVSGLRKFNNTLTTPDSFYATSKEYVLQFTKDEYTIKFFVDAQSMKISNVQAYGADGALWWEEWYSYVPLKNGGWQPETARIHVPSRSTVVELYFDEVSMNIPLSSLSISYPNDVEQVSIN